MRRNAFPKILGVSLAMWLISAFLLSLSSFSLASPPAALTMVQLVVDESDPNVKHLYKPLTLHIGAPW